MANKPPAVLLYISSRCPHCKNVSAILAQLLEQGDIASLEINNLDSNPDSAHQHRVRSVPWFRIGSLVHTGAHSRAEIRSLVAGASRPNAKVDYLGRLFQDGQMEQVIELVRQEPENIVHMMQLLMGDSSKLVERIGIGAVVEEFEAQPVLLEILPALERLARHADAKVRVDTAYYLGLTHTKNALGILQPMLDDLSHEVREEVTDAIALINSAPVQ